MVQSTEELSSVIELNAGQPVFKGYQSIAFFEMIVVNTDQEKNFCSAYSWKIEKPFVIVNLDCI